MMIRKLTLGGILGGVLVFAWGAFSWMVLPWHSHSFERFSDENTVAATLLETAPTKGVYLLPNIHQYEPDLSEEMRAATAELGKERLRNGPWAFVAFSRKGVDPDSARQYILGISINILAALLVTWLVIRAEIDSFLWRLGYIKIIVFAGAVICFLPYWNWFAFPLPYIGLQIVDTVIAWGIGGLAIAKVAE